MIGTIFKKELKDMLRDRRTVMMMIIVPTLIFPVFMNIYSGVFSSFEKGAAEKNIKIGIVSDNGSRIDSELLNVPKELGKKTFIPMRDTLRFAQLIASDSIQIGIYIPVQSDSGLVRRRAVPVLVFHDATDFGMEERATAYLDYVNEKLKKERYREMNLDEAALTPIDTRYRNIASEKEMIGKLAGGFLPYIFIAFGFLGCMYPAIDLFTGEKERGTIETLLTTPVPRWKMLFGKMGVVVLSGLIASTFSLLGLVFSIEVLDIIRDPALLAIIHDILTPGFVVMLYLLLFPLTVFFAGIMIPLAVRAKSFKEAQSVISPMNILVLLPAMVGLFPGIELNVLTALIPVVNVVLATKELIAGTLQWPLIALSFGVMSALALVMVLLSYKRFGSEANVVN